jgi:hypothetical protein
MGSVYSVARHTIIYLGEASVETDTLFTDLGSLCTVKRAPISVAWIYSKFNVTEQDSLYNALETHVVKNAWFTRVWTFQELLLSRDPWVQCGMKRIKWNDLVQLSTLTSPRTRSSLYQQGDVRGKPHISRSSEEKSPNLLSLDFLLHEEEEKSSDWGVLEYMHRARRNFRDYVDGNNSKNTLLALLQLRRGLGASDARDMIYAHLGIAVDSLVGQPALKVDYSKSYQELFTDIAVYFIEHYGDYRIFSHVEENRLEKSGADFPSWVPDWTSKNLDNLSDIIVPDSCLSQPRISESLCPSWSSDVKPQLNCRGTILARIERVGSNVLRLAHFTREEISKAVYDSFHGPPPSSDRAIKMTDGSVAPVLYQNGFGRLLVEVLKFAGLAPSPSALSYVAGFQEPWPEKVSALSSLFGRGLEDIPLHPITLLTILGFCLDVGTGKWILQRSGVPRDAHRKAVRILEMARQSLEGRRLCLCDPGLPVDAGFFWGVQGALVPPAAQIGDLICRMDGDPRFWVLRAAEPVGTFIKKGATFELVGICNIRLHQLNEAIEGTFVLQ